MENISSQPPQMDTLIRQVKHHLRHLSNQGVDAIETIYPEPTAIAPPETLETQKTAGSENPADALFRLKLQIGDCTRCKLCKERKNIVFGEGNPHPEIVLVGEGPGVDEDRLGQPFVGAAGQLLNRIIQAMGLERGDLYICNIVKCHPPGNRDPDEEEVVTCGRFLSQQIEILQPRIIFCLGRISGRFLTAQTQQASLWSMRGKFYQYQGIDVRVTYHPSAVLRNPEYKRPVWEDVQAVMNRLGRPILRSTP